jgi:hypothetical protein
LDYILYDTATGLVENVIVWDGSTPYRIPSTKTLGIDATGKIAIGWIKNGPSLQSPDLSKSVAASNVTLVTTGISPF